MNPIDNWRRAVTLEPPSSIVEYGSIFLLLSALTLAELSIRGVVQVFSDVAPYYVNPRVYMTFIYSMLGMAVLGIGYLVYRRTHGIDGRLNEGDRLRFILSIFLLLTGVTYTVLGTANPFHSVTLLLGTFVTAVVGMGILAVAYLHARGTDIRLDPPEKSAVSMLVVATLIPVLVVALLSFVVQQGMVSTSQWIFRGQYVRPVSLVKLVPNTAFTSIFTAFGAGLLFHGAIQETLREYATPTGAVAGITVMVGYYRWVIERMVAVDSIVLIFSVLFAILLVVLATALTVRLWRTLDLTATNNVFEATTAAVFGLAIVTLLVGGWYYFLGSPDLSLVFVGYAIGHASIIGVAAATYEHTRSVWAPMVPIGTFYAAVNIAVYL